ncbi:MAG: DUF3536 domain-containing protein [Nitrospirae bacterium]|nr:MAG: DUF3536 domain-containing protein [Nitrospirota bacterium]
MKRYICIHGHFYQPPRENPWLEEVEVQDSAYPYHDWNERVTAECYEPNTASRILGPEGTIVNIVNNYSQISFDMGPTLLIWMERKKRDVYEAIIEADRQALERFGHGTAIAQAYNHLIMPLASSRDKFTQVYWGIKDFEYRFGRPPEGMWLPETAVDLESLDIMASLGVKFTILAPHQALRYRKLGQKDWHEPDSEGGIDPSRPYLVHLPSGRTITVFFYDGPISSDVAFGGLLNNGETFAQRLVSAFRAERTWPQIVHIATDGETYGHHHRGGDMALAYCLYYIEKDSLAEITNYGAYLEAHPPEWEAQIRENSSWSCAHGVERWRANCGCTTGAHPGWDQSWRAPLRQAMDNLKARLDEIFETQGRLLFKDPWKARDEYIEVILQRQRAIEFIERHSLRDLLPEETIRAMKLLEMQRHAMLMFTSCGWFFEEVSGIETIQVMMYAARAMQLARQLAGVDLETEFCETLKNTPSNVYRNALEAYEKFVIPSVVDLQRVAAHYAISSVFEEYPEEVDIYCYRASTKEQEVYQSGKLKLRAGRVAITSEITLETKEFYYGVLSMGDHNITAGVREDLDSEFSEMKDALVEAFNKGDIPEVIRTIDRYFEGETFSLWHLFRDQQRKLLQELLSDVYTGMDVLYRQIYENYAPIMNFLLSLNAPVPGSFRLATEHTLNLELKDLILQEDIDLDRFNALKSEIDKWGIQINTSSIELPAEEKLNLLMESFAREPLNLERLESLLRFIEVLKSLSLEINLWKAQNLFFEISRAYYPEIKEKKDDPGSERWLQLFEKLGNFLRVKPQ